MEGLRISQGSGALANAALSKKHPIPAQGAVIVINPTRRHIPIYTTAYTKDAQIAPEKIGVMMAYGYGLFLEAGTDIDQILTAYFTLLVNTLSFGDSQASLEAALRETAFELIPIEYSKNQTDELIRDPTVSRFLDLLGGETNMCKFMQMREQQLVGLGIYLLIIGKNLQPTGYSGWVRNRLRTFNGTLGVGEISVWTDAPIAKQPTMAAMYSIFSASFSLRRCVFRMYLSCLLDQGLVGHLFQTVVNLLQGVEMTHLFNIEIFLFGKYTELMRIRILRDDMRAYNTALEFICSKDENEHSYLKLLYDRQQTTCLNRTNFNLLSMAGMILARSENTSMRNYIGAPQDDTYMSLKAVIDRYLVFRSSLSAIGMINSHRAFATTREIKEITEKVATDFQQNNFNGRENNLNQNQFTNLLAPGRNPADV